MSKQQPNASTITIPDLPDPSTQLDEQIARGEANMEALKPAVDAFNEWQRFVNSLIDVKEGKTHRPATTRRRASGDHRASRGDRPQEFVNVVRESGDEGIAVKEAADKMGLAGPNYLYRLAPELVDEGLIRKDGKRYYAVAEAVAPQEGETENEDQPEAA